MVQYSEAKVPSHLSNYVSVLPGGMSTIIGSRTDEEQWEVIRMVIELRAPAALPGIGGTKAFRGSRCREGS